MDGVQYHEECWPILLTVYPDRPMSDAEWNAYLDRLATYLRRKDGPMILVSDSPGTRHLPNARQRALIAAHPTTELARGRAPSFVAMSSTVFRGIAKAIAWLSGNDHEIVFAKDLEEALRLASEHARKNGIELRRDPKELLRYRAAS